MADGEINRNGATIRIDENGGVQVEPADGQEVEYTGPDRGTDAIRESVKTGSLSHKDVDSVSQSLHANLSAGKLVAYSDGTGFYSRDPASFSDDASALQAVADFASSAISAGSSGRFVMWIPSIKTDGTEWEINSEVVVGQDNKRISTAVIGFGFGESVALRSTINNGNHIFRFQGDVSGSRAPLGSELKGLRFNCQNNDCGIAEFRVQSDFVVDEIYGFNIKGDAFKIDGPCFGGNFEKLRLIMQNPSGGETGRGVVFTDDSIQDNAGDITFGPDVDISSNHYETIVDETTTGAFITFAGKIEGAHGNHMINWPNSGSRLFITPEARIRGTKNGANGIFFDGQYAFIAPSLVDGIAGDGVVIGSEATHFSIMSGMMEAGGISGDTISIANNSPNYGLIPYESCVDGTVSYPSPPWGAGLRHRDGRKLHRTGTVTVPSGGLVEATGFASTAGVFLDWDLTIDSDPNANPIIQSGIGFNDTNGAQSLYLNEIGQPGVSTDVSFRLYTK